MFTAAHKDEMKDDISSKSQHAADEIRSGARRVKNDVENDLSHTAGAVKDDLHDIANNAGRHVRQLANSAEETLVTQIRDNPMQSVLIALGAGFLVGALLVRR